MLFDVIGCSGTDGAGAGESSARVGQSRSALNAAPKLGDFVFYAERSVVIGSSDRVSGGDVGVRSTAPTSFGPQVVLGTGSTVDSNHDILSPSVSLTNASVGDVQTSSLTKSGVVITGQQASFPSSIMPSMPVTTASVPGGANVTVPAFTIQAIAPGNYGALNVTGTLQLTAGTYSFTSVNLATFAHFAVQSGPVTVNVSGTFTAGQGVTILPPLSQPSSQLTINVAGADISPTTPAVSIGLNSTIIALLAAPHGTLSIGNGVLASGAFSGFDVKLGNNVTATYQNGLPATGPTQQGTQQLSGYFTSAIASAPLVGPVPPATTLSMAVALTSPNAADLANKVNQVSDPQSPLYRQYLTPDQFAATYGLVASDYQAVQTWAQSYGLTVSQTYTNRLFVDVTGTSAQFEHALFVNMQNRLRPDGTQFYTLDRDPSVTLTQSVLAVDGTNNLVTLQPRLFGSGPGGVFWGPDFRNAYVSDCQNLDGAGQALGIAAGDGVNLQDIANYQSMSGLGALQKQPVPVHQIVLDDLAVGTTSKLSSEATMDAEVAIAMAPGLAELDLHTGVLVGSMLSSMANTITATGKVAKQLSFSIDARFGTMNFPASSEAMVEALFKQFTMQGQSVAFGSGDDGAYPQSLDDSLILSDSITIVGGTNLLMNGTSYGSEGTWPFSGGGTTAHSLPGYQKGLQNASNKAPMGNRNFPDVAMAAQNIGEVFGNATSNTGGTSASAPLFAGFLALANQRAESNGLASIGFANPALYAIGKSSVSSIVYHDIDDGKFNDGNTGSGPGGFPSVSGYDLTSGWGSPTCNLIDVLDPPPSGTLSAGDEFACSVRPNGNVDCWGFDVQGQMGNGTMGGDQLTPEPVSLSGASAVVAGTSHACAVMKSGALECWGHNANGQLGVLTPSDSATPITVSGLGPRVVGAAAGEDFTCAILSGGTVDCWGYNSVGQLGDGTTTEHITPAPVKNLGGVIGIAAGESHACAVLVNGTVECWGGNFNGQLGNGTLNNSTVPVAVPGITNAIQVSIGNSGAHTCVLLATGAVECWGFNADGELGDGTYTQRNSPVPVSGLSWATTIAAGDRSTCALLLGGTVECWGANDSGQLGNASVANSTNVPVAGPVTSGATAIAVGDSISRFTCVTLIDKTGRCWGSNNNGELGDGATTPPITNTPVVVDFP